MGLKPGECPEEWNLSHPEKVGEIAKSYIDAGADMVETNSFGGTRYKLEHYGLAGKVREINEAAARISRQAAGPDNIVIGSIGPTGKMLIMGDVSEEGLYEAFKEQALALEKGGADAACIETMSDLAEALQAIKAVKENTGLEVISTFTFERTVDGDFKSMMGIGPKDVVRPIKEAGADIIGANCGNGFSGMIDIVSQIREVDKETPILVHANAGLPVLKNGQNVFPETPEEMASLVPDLIGAGANIIGGCCGTTPEHICKIAESSRK
jgi:5-methyltetrahydrofolate--homocysteine methyltransferase